MDNCTPEEIAAILKTVEGILLDKPLLVGLTDLHDYVTWAMWDSAFGDRDEL